MTDDKTWFITGASRGFGREWTIAALERGDRVAATARDTSTLDDLVQRHGNAVLPLQLGRVPQRSEVGLPEYVDMHDRHDLSDEQWDLLGPCLPKSVAGQAGRPWADHRRVVNAVMWRTRSGAAWRDVPTSYGPWKTVYNRHRRWSSDGTWERLLRELQRGSDAEHASWDVGVDSTVIRAHQHAAGAPHTPPGDVSAERLAVALEDFESTRTRPRSRLTGG